MNVYLIVGFLLVPIAMMQSSVSFDISVGCLDGAERKEDRVRIEAVDSKIVSVDGKSYELNPPINLQGPHLEYVGNFSLSVTMTASSEKEIQFVNFYDTLPVIYDEWIQEGRHLAFGIKDNSIQLWAYLGSGTKPQPTEEIILKSAKHAPNRISMKLNSQIGQKLQIEIDGDKKTLHQLPNSEIIFESGKIFFGVEIEVPEHHDR